MGFRPLAYTTPQMEYKELYPTSQDEQLEQAMKFYDDRGFHGMRAANFVNAGMGSGKTRLMQFIRLADLTYVLAPNDTLENQLKIAFSCGSSHDVIFVDGSNERARQQIEAGIKARKRMITFFHHIASSGSDFGPSAKKFQRLMNHFKGLRQLCFIDELDQQLTYLTGGLNPKIDHSKTIIRACERILGQSTFSLNIFDVLRANGVKCIGFSGTMNNLICSKLPSMGYTLDEISILNIHPMEYLYKNLEIIPINMGAFGNIDPYLNELEAMPADKMGLLAFPNKDDIEQFLLWYRVKRGEPLSHVKITSAADADDLSTAAGKAKLRASKYVIGINMVLTGFDLSTHVEGREFALTVLARNMSDKISNPLSKNPDHELHNEVAATLRQFAARSRKGGKCLIPYAYYAIGTLYENLVEVFETIRKGRNEFAWVGPPRTSQVERHAQGLILALKQNLKEGTDRPVVDEILTDLALFDGRHFKNECDTELIDPYWIDSIKLLWDVYAERFQNGMTKEEFEASKPSMIEKRRSTRGPIVQTGDGFRDGREINTLIEEKVKARAAGICMHCSRMIKEYQQGNICHVHPHHKSGLYTLVNLGFGHAGCDAMFDNEHRFIHSPYGGYYLAEDALHCKPDGKQWSQISKDNIRARWNWVMQKMGCATHDEFVAKLAKEGYIKFN
jgi:hypothetical protein